MDTLIKKIRQDYPDYRFIGGKKFMFRYPRTIIIGPIEPHANLLLLHELGHAILGHRDYETNIKRMKMEVDAWEEARRLSEIYGVEFDENVMQDELDSYRDWLHKKSRCPKCGLTRFETPDGQYHCPRCESLS